MALPFLALQADGKKPKKFYGFHTFAEPGLPITANGAFRDNVRYFVQECAGLEDYHLEGMPIWCTFLVYENKGVVLPLYTVEENVSHSVTPFCDYCRCAGWSNHFVSKRKYHFIIPADDEWNKNLEEGAFDLQTHLLHGLIHCNGFGHLVCINGIEGGSNFICGKEIMDLWDRICSTLHARKISVEDLSKKNAMDLRLLYGVTYGYSWFGRWGYRFCRGSYGVKWHNYEKALDILSSLDLDQVIDDFRFVNGCAIINRIIHHYRDLSDANLVTVRDLLNFMLSLKSRTRYRKCPTTISSNPDTDFVSIKPSPSSSPISTSKLWQGWGKYPMYKSTGQPLVKCTFAKDRISRCKKFSKLVANMDSRWPVRRLEHVADVIVDALKEKREANKISRCGMTRQEVRDAARLHIGDTGLIDHVLKVMNNVIVGHYIVRRAVNRSTKVLEYTILDANLKKFDLGRMPKVIHSQLPVEWSIDDDLYLLYTNLFLRYPGTDTVNLAVQTVLYSKIFVKEWQFRDEEDDCLRFICRLASSIDYAELFNDFLPREYVAVPLYATIGDLKILVQNALQDTYCVMDKLEVLDIDEMEGMEDREVLFGVIESGSEISVRVHGIDAGSNLRYEGGAESWSVRCKCGALDDDGERMVACDLCEIWQHTLCNGVADAETVPKLFVCDACCNSLASERLQSGFELGLEGSYDGTELVGGLDLGVEIFLDQDL